MVFIRSILGAAFLVAAQIAVDLQVLHREQGLDGGAERVGVGRGGLHQLGEDRLWRRQMRRRSKVTATHEVVVDPQMACT